MDTLIRAPAHAIEKIPDKLIEATIETIKAGIRLDEREKEAVLKAEATKQELGQKGRQHKNAGKKKQENFLQKVQRKNSYEDVLPVERAHRVHEDRRMGLLIIGDQHRFAGTGGAAATDDLFFVGEPPLDYSFCLLDTINEIVTENEAPQTSRNYKQPRRTLDGRYKTSSLRLSYNVLTNLEGLVSMLYKILDGGPMGLVWLDLCSNNLVTLDLDTLTQLPNIRILYLHGNNIADMLEVKKLGELNKLKSLTLHGNPIEQEDGYRICVLNYLPKLMTLDFFGVTRGDRANTCFAPSYQMHWERKHVELEAKAQALKISQEMSLTARILAVEDDEGSEDGELF